MSDQLLFGLGYYIPECIVTLTMIVLLYLEATFSDKTESRLYIYVLATFGMLATVIALFQNIGAPPQSIFYDAVVIDSFSTIMKLLMTLGTLAVIWLCKDSKDVYQGLKSEFAIMATGVLVGGMLLASANNFLTIYLGIETLSILSYVLASLKKYDSRSSEAGLKYVLYGGIASGLMLFGISHLYGFLGTIQFAGMGNILKNLDLNNMSTVLPSFLLFFVGLGYKVACFPFHMWTPDVYEGAPLPVTAFFAAVPKLAAITALLRVTFVFFGTKNGYSEAWISILKIIAAFTMTIGNVSAIKQRSVKRMLAYSSISHAGFLLLGVLTINSIGVNSILFYSITYLFMTIGAFYICSYVVDMYNNDHLERFSGLIRRYPFMAISMSIILFSLAGIPPFSGFVAKYNIINAIIDSKHYDLAVIAILNSVVALYYYMKLVRFMTLREEEAQDNITGFSFINQLVIVAITIPVVVLGVFWDSVMALVKGSALYIN